MSLNDTPTAATVWPDREHRTMAEVWLLDDDEIEAERRADQERGEQPKDWRIAS